MQKEQIQELFRQFENIATSTTALSAGVQGNCSNCSDTVNGTIS